MAARYSSVEEFVKARGGKRALKKVLIANNGIGAVKAIRSIRRWAYEIFGNEREVSGFQAGCYLQYFFKLIMAQIEILLSSMLKSPGFEAHMMQLICFFLNSP